MTMNQMYLFYEVVVNMDATFKILGIFVISVRANKQLWCLLGSSRNCIRRVLRGVTRQQACRRSVPLILPFSVHLALLKQHPDWAGVCHQILLSLSTAVTTIPAFAVGPIVFLLQIGI
jgi:hypothetical protein